MFQVSRSGSLKIPKKIEIIDKVVNTNKDIIEIKKAYYTAFDTRFNNKRGF